MDLVWPLFGPVRLAGRLASPATAARATVDRHDPGLCHVSRQCAGQGRRPRGDGRHRASDTAPLGWLRIRRIPLSHPRPNEFGPTTSPRPNEFGPTTSPPPLSPPAPTRDARGTRP